MNTTSHILLDIQYLPPIQYVTKWLLHQAVWIEACEHYRKGSYRNRCHIAGPQGVQRLSIPLQSGKNEQLPIREVRIAYGNLDWQLQHWRSIKTAYGKAPFFEFYADELKAALFDRQEYLWEYNWNLLELLTSWLHLSTTVNITEKWQPQTSAELLDFRNGIHPKKQYQRPDPHFAPQPYQQVFTDRNGWLPNLSVLDLLFCRGPESGSILKQSIK